MTKKLNKTALKRVLKMIKQNPQHWDQGSWHCGTSHCFAGFAVLDKFKLPVNTESSKIHAIQTRYTDNERPISFRESSFTRTGFIACEYLGLTEKQGSRLFKGSNSLKKLESIVEKLCEKSTKGKK